MAFHVSGCNKTKTKVGNTLIFQRVNVKTGNGYDMTTGFFTAPVPGTYIFTASVGSEGEGRDVEADIHVNGCQYAEMHGTYTSTGFTSLCVVLKVSDTVRVQTRSDPRNYYCSETVFTGALLQAEI